MRGQFFRQRNIGLFRVKKAFIIKENALCGINEVISEICRHNFCVQIFAPRCKIIAGRGLFRNTFAYLSEVGIKRHIKFKPFYYCGKTLRDRMKKRVRVFSRFFGLRKRNEHIRHLFIVGMSFAGRGGDRISAAGV